MTDDKDDAPEKHHDDGMPQTDWLQVFGVCAAFIASGLLYDRWRASKARRRWK